MNYKIIAKGDNVELFALYYDEIPSNDELKMEITSTLEGLFDFTENFHECEIDNNAGIIKTENGDIEFIIEPFIETE